MLRSSSASASSRLYGHWCLMTDKLKRDCSARDVAFFFTAEHMDVPVGPDIAARSYVACAVQAHGIVTIQ